MKTHLLGAACLLSLLALSPHAAAHGGQYIGPRDVVPPGGPNPGRSPTGPGLPGPTGPTTGQPAPPGAPTPSGPTQPTTGRPQPPGATPTVGPTTRRGAELDCEPVSWDFWWEFNKAPYLQVKEALVRAVPTGSDDFYLGGTRKEDAADRQLVSATEIDDRVLPALKRALDGASPNDIDIVSSCMIALAKIGRDHTTFRLCDVFESRLAAANLEVRQTAALSLGLAGIADEHTVDLLVGLASDGAMGRRAVQSGHVDEPTRAFAVYGLGLLAHDTPKLELQRRTFDAVGSLITSAGTSSRNLCVAAIHAASLLRLGSEPADDHLLETVLDRLEEYYGQRLGAGDELMQAHCATAIAKLIGPRHARSQHFRDVFAADLVERDARTRRGADVQRSCALALGRLGLPLEPGDAPDSPAAKVADALLTAHSDARDTQTRCFALIALGQIGGRKPRDLLLRVFDKGMANDRAWAAIALGIHAFHLRAHANDRDDAEQHIDLIGRTLCTAQREEKNPENLSAYAIALGLCAYHPAAPALLATLDGTLGKQDVAGYACIGLALMQERSAAPRILETVDRAKRRPGLMQQAVVSLGVLGDHDIATHLGAMLQEADTNLAHLAAIASGLSFIGDRRSIPGLVTMLDNRSCTQLQRAFAAVALGGIADRAPLPWNSAIGIDTNYRANTETLTNRSTGILDIL